MKKVIWGISILTVLLTLSCKDDGGDGPDDNNNNGQNNTNVDTDGDGIPDWVEEADPSYTIPSYNDDYTWSGDNIHEWYNRSRWNLANVHDPSVVYDGQYYYMYGTDASFGNVINGHGHFPYRRSKDLVKWDFMGTAMSSVPAWVKDSLNNMRISNGLVAIDEPVYGFWAPVIRKVGTKYRMYYSIIIDNYIQSGLPNNQANFDGSWIEHAFIGMMESNSLALNMWTDKGMVVHSVSDKGTDWSRSAYNAGWESAYFYYNAIDPTFQETPDGKQYLIYGSWHSGIACVELDPETGKPFQYQSVADKSQRIANRYATSRWQGSEGPEIMYNEETGYYYLFLSYDELSVAYNTRVCRSKNIEGPYYGIDGANITDGADCYPVITHPYQFSNHSGWVGFSHNAVFQNQDGDWFYVSQARLPKDTNGNEYANANMMGHVRKIRWTENGWPVVMSERYSGLPEKEITRDELVGRWENITLYYEYQTMQKSSTLVLNADGTATGSISGSWSYNNENKVLTVGNVKLCVEREVDWEANPRKITIVYSGLTANGKYSLWGKKVN